MNIAAQGYQYSFQVIRIVQSSCTVCHLVDFTNFIFGLMGVHDLIKTHCLKDKKIKKLYHKLPCWQQRAWKITDFLGNLSLILGGIISRPALQMSKWMIKQLVSPEKIHYFINQSGCLSTANLYRLIGISAFLLGIPATLKTIYSVYHGILNASSRGYRETDEPYYRPIPLRKSNRS